MTGEQCDCFASQSAGVLAILAGVAEAVDSTAVRVWHRGGAFVELEEARVRTQLVAAANWHALATWCGQLAPRGNAIVLDIGSTTTDVIPLQSGKPANPGRSDSERLLRRELVYTGVRRTPLCALLPHGVAAEWFATTLDVYLILGEIAADDERDTADGKPATLANAHARLARMICADLESSTPEERIALARQAKLAQMQAISRALTHVCERWQARPQTVIVSGSGEFLGKQVLRQLKWDSDVISLAERLGAASSTSACAYAVAMLTCDAEFRLV
jgi:probable H4MPT-linked C1 transfer pathway protein